MVLRVQKIFKSINRCILKFLLIIFLRQIIFQKGAKMINGNDFQALTHNGISQLFSQTFEQQEFILQVIQISTLKEDQYTVFLSDGFTWIKGQLIKQAKANAIKSNLAAYSIIKFKAEDIQTITDSNNQYSFKLRQYTITISNKKNLIGQPVPLKDFNRKKDFINFESGNVISPKKYYTLKQIKQMPAGKQLSLTILGKVVKKPDKVNTVMNIMIEDEERQKIQCCFFADAVDKYKEFIKWGEWYYFEDPVLQVNNKFGNMLELKINDLSNITKQKKGSEVKPGIINYNNYNKCTTPKLNLKQIQNYESDSTLKEFSAKDYTGKGIVEEKDKFIIARPLRCSTMKNNMGRIFQCVDKNGEEIEILLWNDCTSEIKLNESYQFNFLKVKSYRDKLSLQSQKGQTQIISSPKKILSREELYQDNRFKKIEKNSSKTEEKKARYLRMNDIVYSLSEMKEKCQKSTQKTIFIISCGYLTIKFDFMGGNSYDGYSELRRKLFYVHCQKCQSNEYLRSKIQLESMNGKVVCNGCKSETIRILWNIKIIFMDSQTDLACKINSQIAEKLIEMTPFQGMRLYLEDHEALKLLIQKKINFKRGVYKFSSKLNDRHQGERYYNICEYYDDGNKIFVQRSINQLKRTLAAYQKHMQKLKTQKGKDNLIITDENPESKNENSKEGSEMKGEEIDQMKGQQ